MSDSFKKRVPLEHMTLADIPAHLNLISLPASLILPRGTLPALVRSAHNQKVIEKAFFETRLVGVLHNLDIPSHLSWMKPKKQIGTIARITQIRDTAEGLHIILTGVCRFLLLDEYKDSEGLPTGRIDISPFSSDMSENYVSLNRKEFIAKLKAYFTSKKLIADWKMLEQLENEALITVLPMALPLTVNEQQAILNAASLAERAEAFFDIIRK